MLKIIDLTVEGLSSGCVTDEEHPHISFKFDSENRKVSIKQNRIVVTDEANNSIWDIYTKDQIAIPYEGKPLKDRGRYKVRVESVADSEDGEEHAATETYFRTGRMSAVWYGKWITDGTYSFTEKKVSPKPMVFRKKISCYEKVKEAYIYSTALGIYEVAINGMRVGKRYFAPGFTSYKHNLQYQVLDVTKHFIEADVHIDGEKNNQDVIIDFTVAGGWAVGSFIYSRTNRFAADRQALLAEIHILYENGEEEIIGTDDSWLVTRRGPVKAAEFYDGEIFDATVELKDIDFHNAAIERLRVNPKIKSECGSPVTEHEIMIPKLIKRGGGADKGHIYDFGQNFAGIVRFNVNGKRGQQIRIKHAEILDKDGHLNTVFLRSAKAELLYTCKDGEQSYSPRFTYMGFRYIEVIGVNPEDICIEGIALYSDIGDKGEFSCSNEMLNKLQSNIRWGAKSNLVDIPTDCPQRDERMGWTGDIAVFGPTACYNFKMDRFLKKWLKDLRSEQLPTGGIPNTVPANGFGFPVTMPTMAIDFWGDAAVLVPWALYQSEGDIEVLRDNYEAMKKYVDACKGWAGLFSFGKHRYIWNTPSTLHFGDWVAPDVPKMQQWQKRSKWTATASLCNTSKILSEVAGILGMEEDAQKYKEISEKTAEAYEALLTDGNGKLKEEFQTAYVLPLAYHMIGENNRERAVDNLVKLIEKNEYCIGTGFPGTPYILFALADNGRKDVAFKMLLNDKCPSWLYEVKVGATTIWERWDGLDENGECPIGEDGTDMMISYNHYASGAVGDFLYRRVAGIEQTQPGYRTFRIKPVIGGGITSAKGKIDTPYGIAASEWTIEGNKFNIRIQVPVGTECEVEMPDGSRKSCGNGTYSFSTELDNI